jgi:hypothetical protein
MRTRFTYAVVFVVAAAAPLRGQALSSSVSIHGFGSWAFGRTSDNVYLAGTPSGEFRFVSMALNLAARVEDKLLVHAQGEVREDSEDTHTTLNYAFAEYAVSDNLKLRVGQVKHPFGLYTEVRSVGTLRPFLDLPQGFYGPVGFSGDSYKGVGIAGTADAGAWALSYDLYGGGNDLHKFAAPEQYYAGSTLQDVEQESESQSTRNVVGGRLVVQAPLPGLRVGTSAYTGILNEPAANRRTVVALQADYRTNRLTIEAEGAHEKQVRDERSTGGYVQVAYKLTPRWEIAGQGDYLTNRFFGVGHDSTPSLQRHKEAAVALDYWLSSGFVVKAEYHRVNGNRFSMPYPQDLLGVLSANALRTTTHLIQFGGQFSF